MVTFCRRFVNLTHQSLPTKHNTGKKDVRIPCFVNYTHQVQQNSIHPNTNSETENMISLVCYCWQFCSVRFRHANKQIDMKH